jgi:oxalate decarboxylase/phosphoglucose isomerase-like protein (cupin superfamily)
MKLNVNKFYGSTRILKVKDATINGKSVYKNIKGHENEINEVLTDSPTSGLVDIIVCMNILYPGKVNSEFKMTRGHSHNAEEVYVVLKGRGYFMVGKKKTAIKNGDLITIPKNVWHRTVNTGKEKLFFLTVFQKHSKSHLKGY